MDTEQPITHCQICGRPIKATQGPIAHHGYQRPGWGWQSASCLGARYLPYEQNRDRIPQVIDIYKGILESTIAHEKDLIENPPATFTTSPDYHGNTETYTRPDGFDGKANAEKSGYLSAYEKKHNYAVYSMRRDIKDIKESIEHLQRRYAAWPGVVA